MRLWHEKLIDKLPKQHLQGQHRECCAMRGNGWGMNHSTVDYVFENDFEKLVAYHIKVIGELLKLNVNINRKWLKYKYRGKKCKPKEKLNFQMIDHILVINEKVYSEHDENYMKECIDNLLEKGVTCRYFKEV
ncbi:MAG: TIGR02328 family protein [Halanaerobiales bacterium]